MENQNEIQSLARRVDDLERQNKRQGRFIKAGAVGALLLLVLGAKAAPALLEAQKFVLKDAKNTERIVVGQLMETGQVKEGFGCLINDVNGKPSFRVDITDKGTLSFKSLVFPNMRASSAGYDPESLDMSTGRL